MGPETVRDLIVTYADGRTACERGAPDTPRGRKELEKAAFDFMARDDVVSVDVVPTERVRPARRSYR